jgi:hypothetical protein
VQQRGEDRGRTSAGEKPTATPNRPVSNATCTECPTMSSAGCRSGNRPAAASTLVARSASAGNAARTYSSKCEYAARGRRCRISSMAREAGWRRRDSVARPSGRRQSASEPYTSDHGFVACGSGTVTPAPAASCTQHEPTPCSRRSRSVRALSSRLARAGTPPSGEGTSRASVAPGGAGPSRNMRRTILCLPVPEPPGARCAPVYRNHREAPRTVEASARGLVGCESSASPETWAWAHVFC